jgi:hypothetical protein
LTSSCEQEDTSSPPRVRRLLCRLFLRTVAQSGRCRRLNSTLLRQVTDLTVHYWAGTFIAIHDSSPDEWWLVGWTPADRKGQNRRG